MKKRGYIGRLAALALVLCMVTMSLTAGTLAKYASEASGSATATVAKWKIGFSDGSGTTYEEDTAFTLDLKDTALGTQYVKDQKIAPGAAGTFNLAVDGTGTEVAFTYTIELNLDGITKGDSAEVVNDCPLKFYKKYDAGTETYSEQITGSTQISGDVLVDAAQPDAQTVYWVWDAGTTEAENIADTALGEESAGLTAGLIYHIPVTIKAEQTLPTT